MSCTSRSQVLASCRGQHCDHRVSAQPPQVNRSLVAGSRCAKQTELRKRRAGTLPPPLRATESKPHAGLAKQHHRAIEQVDK
jgi:hypothetical protein